MFKNFYWLILAASSVLLISGFIIKENESFLQNPYYYNQQDIEKLFADLQKTYPNNVKVETIGRSYEGRDILAILISRYARKRNNLTPTVKYIANMHGDETVGRQMLLYLAQYLLNNYETNPSVARLVNTTDIYLVPTMNPDGFAKSKEGNCESLEGYVGRSNAAGEDLNRDFPDRFQSNVEIKAKNPHRQPETLALMEWFKSKPFVLSANFHGGAVVASYPYDNSIKHNECCEQSLTPDDRVFKLMAHTYADNHPVMHTGKNCNETFSNGIVNGADWYELNGGMQDFNYVFNNCFELTVELSCCKYPLASTLPTEWANNKNSLLQFIKLAHIGVKGIVTDVAGYPISGASINVAGIDKVITTNENGEYWRLLTPGLYAVEASYFGYASKTVDVHVTNESNEALRVDFTLTAAQTDFNGIGS